MYEALSRTRGEDEPMKHKHNIIYGVIVFNSGVSEILAKCSKCGTYFVVPEHRAIYPMSPDTLTQDEIDTIQWINN